MEPWFWRALVGVLAAQCVACTTNRSSPHGAVSPSQEVSTPRFVPATAVPVLEAMRPANLDQPGAAEVVATLNPRRLHRDADGVLFLFAAAAGCTRRDHGCQARIEGPLELKDGTRWTGEAMLSVHDDSRHLAAYGVRATGTATCRGREVRTRRSLDGQLVTSKIQGIDYFAIDAVITGDDCDEFLPAAVVYEGRSQTQDGVRHYSGQGQIGIFGWGKVDVSTAQEVVDCARCRYEPLRGRTEARAGGHRLVIDYDGSDDCSAEQRAPFALDGSPAGTVRVPRPCCAASPGTRRRASAPLTLGALLAVAGLRRRARRAASGRR